MLSEEDKRLWASVARQAVPLKGHAVPEMPAPPAPSPPAAKPAGPQALPSAKTGFGAMLNGHKPAPQQRLPSQHPIERPTKRKISKGRIAIDARIDLHEMNQTAAHSALAGFLSQAQAMGLRHVLVITGRGGVAGSSRGVLRRVVPQWFASPQFRMLVSGFESAERHHGGDGALYVRVRRHGVQTR